MVALPSFIHFLQLNSPSEGKNPCPKRGWCALYQDMSEGILVGGMLIGSAEKQFVHLGL